MDRKNNLKRTPRPNYYIFKDIVTTHKISEDLRDSSRKLVQANMGKDRPFCRAMDGKTPFHTPAPRAIVKKDWRFSRLD